MCCSFLTDLCNRIYTYIIPDYHPNNNNNNDKIIFMQYGIVQNREFILTH